MEDEFTNEDGRDSDSGSNNDSNTIDNGPNYRNPGINFNIASTNARSIAPKMNSMIECFRNLDLCFFAVTETWLRNDRRTRGEISDVAASEKIAIITRSRDTRGGGVAIAYDTERVEMREEKIRANKWEVLFVKGQLQGIRRKICVVVVYVPPKTTRATILRWRILWRTALRL